MSPWYIGILHIQQMLVANECNKWDAAFLQRFRAFAELTSYCLKVSAPPYKHFFHTTFYTSIYPFICSPVPPHGGWKIGTWALVAEESVTNASLDTWRGHSSLLSHGHNVPLRHLLLMHALFHTHPRSWNNHILPTSAHAHRRTLTAWHRYWPLSTADSPSAS